MDENKDEVEVVQGLDDDDDDDSSLHLKCSDGKSVDLPRKGAKFSDLLQSVTEDKHADEVDLPHLDSRVVTKIVEYMVHHIDQPPRTVEGPLKSNQLSSLFGVFDAEFADSLDQQMLFQVLLAANYMAVKPLVTLLCAKIATMMANKTPHNIRRTFGIRDFTPSERIEVQKHFPDLLE